MLSNFQNVSREFCIRTPSTFFTMGGLRRKCHSVLTAKYTSFVILLQMLLTATTHHTHYKTPRSNSRFVEVCHIANDNKSFFCLLLVIIALSLPYSFDRVLNDQELQQHSNFKAWSDFNMQIQCDEPGKQPKSVGYGRKRWRIWYAMCLYGAELPALSLNGIGGYHEVHPPSGARVDEALIPRGNDKEKC